MSNPARRKQAKCSLAMWRMLNNLASGRDPWHGVKGTTAAGERTMQAMYRRGWINKAPDGLGAILITAEGRAVWSANSERMK